MCSGCFWEKPWFGKNVLITGGNGFVASNLAIQLMALGANVHVTMRRYSDHDTIKMLSGEQLNYNIEITNMQHDVKNIFDRGQIDTVFHLAASAIVSQAANSPLSTFYNNIVPTLNIIEAARMNNIKRVIIASTDKAYGDHSSENDPEGIPYREHYALRGLDVYSASKACVDMISQAMASQYKQHVFITRCGNIYGPGDFNFSRIIPRTIMRILSNRAAVINEGNEKTLREYAFVDDVVSAYIFLAEHVESYYEEQEYPRKGEDAYGWPCFNIGNYTEDDLVYPRNLPNIKNVKSVISMISEIMQREYNIKALPPEIIPKGPNFIEIPDQYLNSSKIYRLGFKARTSFEEGLRKTINWYYDNREFLRRYGALYLK
jgi:CDP-glucose 4,6-dehydratase